VSGLGGWLFATLGVVSPALFAALLVAIAFAVTGSGRRGRRARSPWPPRACSPSPSACPCAGKPWQRWDPTGRPSSASPSPRCCSASSPVSRWGRHRDVDAVTGILAMIAGGAAGLVAVAHDLGADERIVVVTQYLRVALVVLSMPLIVTYGFAAPTITTTTPPAPDSAGPWWISVGFMAVAMIVGTGAAMLIRLPIPATLGPLLASAACELAGWAHSIHIPAVVLPIAFLIIGWQAGLSFTRDSVAALGRIFIWALLLMVVATAACAGLGVLLSAWTGISVLQGYLATTPGGLAAVLAVAASTDSDATVVAASQVIRLVLMLLAAPLVVWVITRRHRPSRTATEVSGDRSVPARICKARLSIGRSLDCCTRAPSSPSRLITACAHATASTDGESAALTRAAWPGCKHNLPVIPAARPIAVAERRTSSSPVMAGRSMGGAMRSARLAITSWERG